MDVLCFFDSRKMDLLRIAYTLRSQEIPSFFIKIEQASIEYKHLISTISKKHKIPISKIVGIGVKDAPIDEDDISNYPFLFKLQSGISMLACVTKKSLDTCKASTTHQGIVNHNKKDQSPSEIKKEYVKILKIYWKEKLCYE